MTDETDESRFLQLPSEGSAPKIGNFPEDILTQYKYNSSPRGCAIIIRWVFPAIKVWLSPDLYCYSAMKTSRPLLPTGPGVVTRLMWRIWRSSLKCLAWRSQYWRMSARQTCWRPWNSLERPFCKWSLTGCWLHYFPFSQREVDLSFVCILSHGSSANTIVDINGQDVQVEEEIIKEFDNTRCPQLIGKF